MAQPVIPFAKVTSSDELEQALIATVRSGWWAAGPQTEAFEKEFSEYIGAKYGIFTNSCTSALEMAHRIARKLYGWKKFSYTPNTYCATYASGVMVGQEIDQDNPDYNVTVHFGGEFRDEACFIEDSAHRIEPYDKWVGHIKCYSFYVTKNLPTFSSGFFATNDEEIYNLARLYWKDGLSTSTYDRSKGKIGYEVIEMAGAYDGNDIAATFARVHLKKLPEFNKKRTKIRDYYNSAFNQQWSGTHLYPYYTPRYKKLLDELPKQGIQVSYFYPGTGPEAVFLPIYPDLSDQDIAYIVKTVKALDT